MRIGMPYALHTRCVAFLFFRQGGGTHLVTNSNAKFSVGLPSIVFGYILTMCSFPLNSHSSEKLLQGAETCHLPNFVSKKLPIILK